MRRKVACPCLLDANSARGKRCKQRRRMPTCKKCPLFPEFKRGLNLRKFHTLTFSGFQFGLACPGSHVRNITTGFTYSEDHHGIFTFFGILPRDLHVRNITTGFTCSECHHGIYMFGISPQGFYIFGISNGAYIFGNSQGSCSLQIGVCTAGPVELASDV